MDVLRTKRLELFQTLTGLAMEGGADPEQCLFLRDTMDSIMADLLRLTTDTQAALAEMSGEVNRQAQVLRKQDDLINKAIHHANRFSRN